MAPSARLKATVASGAPPARAHAGTDSSATEVPANPMVEKARRQPRVE